MQMLDDFALCAVAPSHPSDGDEWLFGAKYRIGLVDGVYPVGVGSGLEYRFEVRDEERMVDSPATANSLTLEEALWGPEEQLVPDPSFRTMIFQGHAFVTPELDDEPWFLSGGFDTLGVYVAATTVTAAELALTHQVVLDPTTLEAVFTDVGRMYLCDSPDTPTATILVELADGEMTFEVRPDGLPVRAFGTVETLAFDVDDYFRLGYSQWGIDVLSGPMFGVMLDEPGPGGECAFYVALAGDGVSGPFEAWWLDCDGARIREVAIADFVITPVD